MPKKIIQSNPRPFAYRNRILHCDGVALSTLADEQGTPLYVYSAQQISQRFQLFEAAFAQRPRTICYAVKANSSLAILRLLAKQGAGFDIVSGESWSAFARPISLRSDASSSQESGNRCGRSTLRLRPGILLFNVESEAELHLLAARAEALGIRARFALRVNPDVFAETPSLHLDRPQRAQVRHRYQGCPRHLSQGRQVEMARRRRCQRAHLARRSARSDRSPPRLLVLLASSRNCAGMVAISVTCDAGGGLGIDYGTAAFDPEQQVRRYAAALNKGLAGESAHLASGAGPLHCGTGRSIADSRPICEEERLQDVRHHRLQA